MKPITGMVLFGLVLSWSVQAASFDCTKAKTKVENLVCNNKKLSELDVMLNATYRRARVVSMNESALKRSQQAWLKTRFLCASSECLEKLYLQRIEWLSRQPRKPMHYKLVMSKNDLVCRLAIHTYNRHINEEFPPPPASSIQQGYPTHAPLEISPHWRDGGEPGTWLAEVDLDWDGKPETILKSWLPSGFVEKREQIIGWLDVVDRIAPDSGMNRIELKHEAQSTFPGGTYNLHLDNAYPPGSFGKRQYDRIYEPKPGLVGIETTRFDVVLLGEQAYLTFVSNDVGEDFFEDWRQRKWRVVSRYLQPRADRPTLGGNPDEDALEDICYMVLIRSTK